MHALIYCKTAGYTSWRNLVARCTNPNNPAWHRYGGRGIKVCDRWMHDFKAFITDMGPKPSADHSIDRFPNNDGNYEPDNCRWSTRKQQAETRDMTAQLAVNLSKTHCPKGHEYSGYNLITKTYKKGRWCRACHNSSKRAN